MLIESEEFMIKTYREALTEAMREELQRDDSVILMGEDVGVYGGNRRGNYRHASCG